MYYGEKRVENPIRWGMVGGGRAQIGYIHRSAALRDFNFELVAGAFDIDPERSKDFGKQLHVDPDRCYPDYKTMFAEETKRPDGVQAVSIATPNGMHYEVCKAALEAGLHVVCEKPLCFTSEQADELVKAGRGETPRCRRDLRLLRSSAHPAGTPDDQKRRSRMRSASST